MTSAVADFAVATLSINLTDETVAARRIGPLPGLRRTRSSIPRQGHRVGVEFAIEPSSSKLRHVKQKKVNRRLIFWVISGLLVVFGIGAVAYGAYFSTHGLPGSSVAGTPVTGQTEEEVAEQLAERAQQVTLTLRIDEHTRELSLADLGISVDAPATATKAFAANDNVGERFSALFTKQATPVSVTSDQHALDSVVSDLISEFGEPATDATVTLGEDGLSFGIEPAKAGLGVDASELSTAAFRAAETLTSQTVEMQTSQVDPKTSTEQAQAIADEANRLVELDVRLIGRLSDSYPASAAQKAQWIVIPTEADGSLGKPTIDHEKAATWVEQTAANTGVSVINGVRNVNQAGTVLSTMTEARAGWRVNNVAETTEALVATLTSGEPFTGTFAYDEIEPTYNDRVIADGAQNLAYPAAPGEKWIDVNLSTNSATAYEGATPVRGPMYFVPGMPEMPTPTGKFNVYLKYQSQTMRGTNLDGSTYESPNVPWVTYFTGSIAFHGAPWRDSFGWSGPGGSHGCLNMPVADAQWIHGWAPMGSVVLSHY